MTRHFYCQLLVVVNEGLIGWIEKWNATFTRPVQALQSSFRENAVPHCGDALAHLNCMKLDLMICLGILLAILFIGVVGAFFLYVPALTVLTVVTLLLGLGLMFALGMMTGRRSRKLSPFTHRAMPIRRLSNDTYVTR
jgi:hypothetical protein